VVRRLIRDPLFHFALAGALLFLAYGLVGGDDAKRAERIVVSPDQAGGFERIWLRPPTDAELDSLVDDHVVEEMLYREALALGLDRDDQVVRRRMRQKMEFLNDARAEAEPSEADLQEVLAADPERFALPSRISFSQIVIRSQPGDDAPARAAALLERLVRGEAPAQLGDPTLLPRELDRATPAEVARRFGEDFASAVQEAPLQVWSGPIASSFGLHLVRVSEREAAQTANLEQVRSSVELEWASRQRALARERLYAELRARYEVELPSPRDSGARENDPRAEEPR